MKANIDTRLIEAPIQGTVLSVDAAEGDLLAAGQPVLVMEAMKMEHVVCAPTGGALVRIGVSPGDTVFEGHPLRRHPARRAARDPRWRDTATDDDTAQMNRTRQRHAPHPET